jgi:dynein heavy chain
LELNKSTFINQFRRLQDEIREARKEANENFMYLSTLEEYFETLLNSGSEFKELPDIFLPIMHSIMLIFSNSNYYKSPSRIVLLIREICNAIIIRATEYIPGETIIGSI